MFSVGCETRSRQAPSFVRAGRGKEGDDKKRREEGGRKAALEKKTSIYQFLHQT
jgi:hypothetical protein